MSISEKLTARMEPFDTFWEGPDNIEKGYRTVFQFYKENYLKHMPDNKDARILVISCGPGYFMYMLNKHGYNNALGIDSDLEKIKHAKGKGLNCRVERAFEFLEQSGEDEVKKYDVIVAEQEINHLTKEEIVEFLNLCWNRLDRDGTLIIHSLNGANPITGSEALSQNIDHFNTFTENSMKQILEFCNYKDIKVIPLNLYVFYSNPLNYVAMFVDKLNTLLFRFNFTLYGKTNKLFTKKIAAICRNTD